MGRKAKIATNKNDRADQRRRTEHLKKVASNSNKLQKTPPAKLQKEAKQAYRDLYPILDESGFIVQADLHSVVLLCMQIQIYRQAYDNISKHGIETEIWESKQDSSGKIIGKDFKGFKANPAVRMLSDATSKVQSLSDDLGLAPGARARLLETVEKNTGDESIGDMLNEGSDF